MRGRVVFSGKQGSQAEREMPFKRVCRQTLLENRIRVGFCFEYLYVVAFLLCVL